MTAKRFNVKDFCVYEDDNPIGMTLRDCCKKLNELHEENEDRFNEQMYLQKQLHNTQKELEPIRKICKKYRIPIKDLPDILEEYILIDNEIIEQKNIENLIKESLNNERTELGKSVLKQLLEQIQ